jgi:hypothetical protein
MLDARRDDHSRPPAVKTAWGRLWDQALMALVLVRMGQELGADSRTAQAVATTIEVVINVIGKVLP